ncbi:flavodoxin family protein [Desulforamulus aquiferis]|uniref:Flavodoxin family protein n=1 Tax=Desulforamulus aquiferis TaxID=1397668 RepID=A0AAW7ZGZ0_9FIRM|nr:flavodoxin family protein [Desulforamulus aquiferis]MDO7788301.1 flavodoxin family protein [Desulforamulus aquiferis]
MLVIGLNGSPNNDGNTVFLLKEALGAASELGAETKLINVAPAVKTLNELFCDACTTPCAGVCYQGTKVEELLNQLKEADGIIMASPVYFGTVASPLKILWDKTRAIRKEKALVDVVGAAVAVGGSRFGGQETTIRAMQDMMLVQGMTIVGDGSFLDDAGHQGASAQKPSDKDQIGIKRSQILGRRVAEVAQGTMALRERKKG